MAKEALEFEAKVGVSELNRLLRDLQTGAQGAAQAINDAFGGTVTKKLVIQQVVDGNGVRQLVASEKERLSVADAIESKLRQIQKVERGSVTSLRQQVNEAKQARDAIAKYETSFTGIGTKVERISDTWAAQNQRLGELQRQLDVANASGFWEKAKTGLRVGGLVDFANGLTQVTIGLQSASILVGQFVSAISNVVNAAAEIQSFSLSFKAIGLGAAGASDALQQSADIALGLGTNLNTVQEGFKQLSPVVLNSGGSIQDVSNIVKSLSSRFAAFGISGDRARRVTNGVIQAFAKGKLQAEELTQQISEADPAFKTDLAGALKISVAELEKWVKQGKVTPEVLIDAIPQLSKASLLFGKLGDSAVSAAASLEKGNVTIDQVRNNIATINQLSLRNFATGFNPVINVFLELQAIIADFLNRISRLSAIESIGKILGNIGKAGNRLLQVFLTIAESVLRVAAAIAPLIEKLTSIPGVIEIIGLAIVGKFIKPLQGLISALGATGAAGGIFSNKLAAAWKNATEPSGKFINAIKEAQRVIEQPVKPVIQATTVGTTGISTTKKDLAAEKASAKLSKQLDKTNTKIQTLKGNIQNIGPIPDTASNSLRGLEGEINNVAAATPAISQEFNKSLAALRKLDQTGSLSGFVSGIKVSEQAVGQLTTKLTQASSGRQFVRLVTPEFLAQTRELAKTNAPEALRLLQISLKAVEEEASRLETIKDPIDRKALVDVRDNALLVKNEIASLGDSISRLPEGKIGLGDELKNTTEEAAKLKNELNQTGKSFSEKEIKNQLELQDQLRESRARRRELYAEQEKASSAVRDERRQRVGFDPERLKNTTFNVEENTRVVQENAAQVAIASSKKVQAYDKEIAALKKQLDAYRKLDQVGKGGVGGLSPAGVAEADRLRNAIGEAQENRAGEVAAIKEKTRALLSLDGVTKDAAASTGDLTKQNKALTLQRDVLGARQNAIIADIQKEERALADLNQERAKVTRRQATFTGAEDAAKNAEALREISRQEGQVRSRLSGLRTAFLENTKAYNSASVALNANRIEANSLAAKYPALGSAKRAVGAAAQGLLLPIKGLAGTFAAAGRGAGALATGLLSVLGPLEIVLIAVAVAQSAYATANEKAAEATRKNAQQAETYAKILKDISPGTEETPELGPIQRAWELFSIEFADTADFIGKKANELFASLFRPREVESGGNGPGRIGQIILSNLSFIPKALGDINRRIGLGFTPAGLFSAFVDGVTDADIAVRKAARGINESLKGVRQSATTVLGKIEPALKAARAAGGAGFTVSDDSVARYREIQTAVQQTSQELAEAQAAVDEYKKKSKDLKTPEAKAALKELNDNLAETKTRWKQATDALRNYGQEFGALRDTVIKQDALGIGGINEALKEARGRLELQIPDTDSFRAAAADVASLELQLQKLQDRAKSPVEISAGISEAISKQETELKKQLDKRTTLLADPAYNAGELDELDKKILTIRNNIELLKELRIEVNANSIDNAKKRIDEIEKKIIKLDVDSPELPALISQLIDFQQKADELDGKRILITAALVEEKLASGEAPSSLKNLSEQAQRFEQVLKTLDFKSPDFRPTLNSLITAKQRSQDIEAVFQRLSRTPYEVKIQTRSIDTEFRKSLANLQFTGPQQGPLREAVTLIAESNRSIADAQDKYAERIRQAEESRKAGLIGEKEAANIIAEAGRELETSTNNAKANLISAAQNYRQQLSDAQTSLSNLVLSKPQFFTPQEVQRERDRVNKEFEELVLSLGLKVTLTGTPDEILKQKQEFIDTRKQANNLQASIQALANAIQLLNNSLTGGNQLGQLGQDLTSFGNAASNVKPPNFQVIGDLENQGQRYLVVLNSITGQTKTLTQTEAQRLGIISNLSSEYQGYSGSVDSAAKSIDKYSGSIEDIPNEKSTQLEQTVPPSNEAEEFTKQLALAAGWLEDSAEYSREIASNLLTSSFSVSDIADSIRSLQGLDVKIRVTGVKGYWTGGPTTAGELLRINELGQEGFITASGQMKPINKPRNALWRAPSTGYVIPAHIWSEINTPTGAVNARTPAAPVTSGGSMRKIASILRSAISSNNNTLLKEGIDRLATIQARQATKIGKLSHAVDQLSQKDWNVNVSLTNNSSDIYANRISRGLL